MGGKFVYYGRIVTMDAGGIIDDGAMYVSSDVIWGVQKRTDPFPASFDGATQIETGGTIFPGLIELHTHRSFNMLPMAVADQRYSNRDQWRRSPANKWNGSWWYNATAGVPMDRLIAAGPDFRFMIATYIDTKSIVAGTTTTQEASISYDGGHNWLDLPSLVRTVENPNDMRLPTAESRVDDFDSAGFPQASELNFTDFAQTLRELKGAYLLHLCEGYNSEELPGIVPAREHFDVLSSKVLLSNIRWALSSGFAGVHCLALTADDFAILAYYKSSFIWSPLSNFVLYGQTADVQAAIKSGVIIGLGADWSVTGSKNLFGEMKAARAVSDYAKLGFSDQDIVAMATINAANILHWEKYLGSLTPGKIADFIVINGTDGDPYYQLLSSMETAISLVVIEGNAVFGTRESMKQCGATGEVIIVGGAWRVIALRDSSFTFAKAAQGLRVVLNSPEPPGFNPPSTGDPTHVRRGDPVVLGGGGGLYYGEVPGFVGIGEIGLAAAAENELKMNPDSPPRLYPNSWLLDPLTVADDSQFFQTLQFQTNLPRGLASAIKALYVYR